MNLRLRLRTRITRWLTPYVTRILLAEPLVWGDPERLTIAPSAVVNNALFNLISGTITVEKDVLLGHSVSLLTGTHDFSKLGQARQKDTPLSGRDIVIKQGAWLASHVLVLGPCVIGKHAVVAAGSLVNSDVPDYAIAVGRPAKVVGTVPSTGD